MNIESFLKALARRWYIVAAGLLVTALAVMLVGSHVSPTYSRTATQVLIPGTQSYPQKDNPYLYVGNLSQAADVLVSALNADSVVSPIVAGHSNATLTITGDANTGSPMIVITATASSDATSADMLRSAVAQISPVLLALQERADVPHAALIKAVPVTYNTESLVSQKPRLEAMGGIAAAGVLVTLLIALLVDRIVSWFLRRARNRAGREQEAESRLGSGADADRSLPDRHPMGGEQHDEDVVPALVSDGAESGRK